MMSMMSDSFLVQSILSNRREKKTKAAWDGILPRESLSDLAATSRKNRAHGRS